MGSEEEYRDLCFVEHDIDLEIEALEVRLAALRSRQKLVKAKRSEYMCNHMYEGELIFTKVFDKEHIQIVPFNDDNRRTAVVQYIRQPNLWATDYAERPENNKLTPILNMTMHEEKDVAIKAGKDYVALGTMPGEINKEKDQ